MKYLISLLENYKNTNSLLVRLGEKMEDGSIISIEVMNASKIFRGDIKKVIDAASACSKN